MFNTVQISQTLATRTQQTLKRWLTLLVAIALVAIAIFNSWVIPTASARVMREELQSGDILYKSLRTLNDNRGYSWQAIAFTQLPSEGGSENESGVQPESQSEVMYLRLVGFPGKVSIDRSKPLMVEASGGKQFALPDRSDLIFKNGLRPQPNVGQYPLANLLEQVRSPTPLRLTLATEQDPIELKLSRAVVEEWLDVNQHVKPAG